MNDDEVIAKLNDPYWRINNLYWILDKEGRRVKFKLNHAQEMLYHSQWYMNVILKARQLGMCLDPDTKVLRADLTWSRIADIKPGDKLVGVDEHTLTRGKRRRMRESTVQAVAFRRAKRYKLHFDDGSSVICTGGHRWLSRKSATDYRWRSIDQHGKGKLCVGTKIRRILDTPWEKGGYEDGWFGGILDGEGSLANAKRLGGSVSVSQVSGSVFNRMEAYLRQNKYTYRIEIDKAERKSKYGTKPVNKLVVARLDEMMRLVGVTRPSRFMERNWWDGKEMPQVASGPYSVITEIEELGVGEVVDLQTSTKTFIAEGLVSHNSTYIAMLFLDRCLFNANKSAGVIAHTREDATHLFKRIKYAYDQLPPFIRNEVTANTNTVRELTFSNDSSIRVGTSLRSATIQYLHISEFGKIAARFPDKAREIVTGSLNTVQAGQYVFVESTAEGRSGSFYEMCQEAKKLIDEGRELTPLDFKLHFFPWFESPEYTLDYSVRINDELSEYFTLLSEKGINLTEGQKAWYAKKLLTQGDDMKREYPSTPEEAFEVAHQGEYYAKQISAARRDGRLTRVLYDPNLPVHTAWDLGFDDSTAIVFFQTYGQEIRVLETYENSGEPLTFYLKYLKEKDYVYGKHIAPHDVEVHEYTTGHTRAEVARNHGIKFTVAPKLLISEGIDALRNILHRCYFDEVKCELGIQALESYKREWDDKHGCWKSKPLHNWASHTCDAFRYLAIGLGCISTDSMSEAEAERMWEKYAVGV